MSKRILACLVLAALSFPLSAQKAVPDPFARIKSSIETRTLENGLKVVVWPDHDIPNVALFNWFRVGSRNEYPGITGLSHFFEHMMFNGAKKYGPGEFDRVMEANGGRNNAYTSENVTVYQDWFPKNTLELIFDLEADRMRDLSFDPKMIESERGVVYSERRSSVDNNNANMLGEQIQSTAYLAHPYQFPTIGWPSDIESWKNEDLVRYFKTYYAPNNATLVVVGDVTPAEVFRLAEKYLQPIPSQPPPDPIRTKEPEQLGERRVTIRKFAQTPLLQYAYHSGPANDPEAEVLDLLMAILTDGDSSRLHRRLVEQEGAAIDVTGFVNAGFDPSLTWLLITLPAGGDLAKTERLVDEELQKIITSGVTGGELRKAKNISVADFWRNLSTISGTAQAVGSYEVFNGDYRQLFDAPARYEAVTAEQIQKLAAKIFRPANRTVGTLIPETAPAVSSQETTR